MANVAITYVGDSSLVFALYHPLYCEKIGACTCTVEQILRPVAEADGSFGQKYAKSVTPKSVYINKGETVILDEEALKLSPLFDLKRKELIKVKVIEPEIVAAPVQAVVPTKSWFNSDPDEKTGS